MLLGEAEQTGEQTAGRRTRDAALEQIAQLREKYGLFDIFGGLQPCSAGRSVRRRRSVRRLRRAILMTDPYEVLGLSTDSDDEAIRRRYLELVRQFPPERNPEKFAAVRAAYENLKDVATRLRRRVFEAGQKETVDALIEELECRSQRRRLSLQTLLSSLKAR